MWLQTFSSNRNIQPFEWAQIHTSMCMMQGNRTGMSDCQLGSGFIRRQSFLWRSQSVCGGKPRNRGVGGEGRGSNWSLAVTLLRSLTLGWNKSKKQRQKKNMCFIAKDINGELIDVCFVFHRFPHALQADMNGSSQPSSWEFFCSSWGFPSWPCLRCLYSPKSLQRKHKVCSLMPSRFTRYRLLIFIFQKVNNKTS